MPMNYLKARKTSKITCLGEASSISIFAPEGNEASHIIEKLIKKLEEKIIVTVYKNPEPSLLYTVENPIILIGNLSNSRCVEMMYYKYLLVTDLTYPGVGGFEVRTLLDPFATGFNILHLCYSDISGLEKAFQTFIKNIYEDYIGYLCEIFPTRLPIPQTRVEYICADKIDFEDETFYYTALQLEDKGYIGYLTGDTEQLEEFNTALEKLIDAPLGHLKLYKRCMIWRLLEVTGMLDDEIVEPSVNFFYNWADGEEGVGSFLRKMYQSPYFPRQNHGLMPAFGVYLLANYFDMYYPELERPTIWREAAKRVFAPYEKGSWKPLCDGLCHGWWMSQPAMLDYALFDEDHTYFTSGGAEKAALCAMAVINNEGWMPCSGDANHKRNFPHYTLDISAAYSKDGRYRFISELAPEWRRAYNYPTLNLLRRFDISVQAVEPTELLGIKVIPIDPLVYNAWKYESEIASMVADTPPYDPIEVCFDKMTVRTGFKQDDVYLLIDGLGGGSHSYADAMAILEYEVFGISFIVSEDSLIFSDPVNENTLTIYRDGIAMPIPAFSAIESTYITEDNCYYIRLRSSNYNGTVWRREFYLIPDTGLIIQDTVTAEINGMYTLESHYRCPGIADLLEERRYKKLYTKRRNAKDEEVNFELATVSSAELSYNMRVISFTESMYRSLPGSLPPMHKELDDVYYLKERYHLEDDELYLNSYDAKTNLVLEVGESVVFTSFAFPTKANRKTSFDMSGENVVINIDGRPIKTPLKSHNLPPIIEDNESSEYLKPYIKFNSSITYSGKDQDGSLLCGLQDGRLIHLNGADSVCVASLEGKINAAAYNGTFYVVSHGKAALSMLDANGQKIWTTEVKRIPTLYPWWELNDPTAVRLVVGKYKGQDAIIAGCGDDNVHFYSMEGEYLGKYYFDTTGVPDLIKIYDVNQDGQDEILIASSILTCTSHIDIINMWGESLERFGGEGWTSNSTCIRCFSYKGKVYIAHGIRQRFNCGLRVFDKTAQDEQIKGRYIIKESVAGAVAGFAVLPESDIITVGTSQGFIIAYNLIGQRLWFNSVKGTLCSVIEYDQNIYAADMEGIVYIFSLEGTMQHKLKSDIKKPQLYVIDRELYAIGENKIVKIKLKR
jgi:outer membrane protein assembly factor BamB